MAFILTDNNSRYIGKQGNIVDNEKEARRWNSEIKALN